jgi:tetratricopeptide (TPR) repeat protein
VKKQLENSTQQRGKRNLSTLLGVLFLLLVSLFLTRWFLFRKPPLPPASATIETKMAYWQGRIKKDVSDKEAYVELGKMEEAAGFFLAAQRHLDAARALGVPDKDISAPLGRALARLAQPDKAKIEMEKAVALSPGQWEPVRTLTGFYIQNNAYTKARDILLTFWQGADRNKLTEKEWEQLVLAFEDCGDTKNTYAVVKEFVRAKPSYPGGQILAARCAFAGGDASAARTYVEAALKETPNEAAALYFYGLILRELKDYDAALHTWEKANTINPKAFDVYARIGEEYIRRKDYKRAAIALEHVAVLDQRVITAVQAAEAHKQAGNREDEAYWEAVATGLQGNYAKSLEWGQKAANTTNPQQKRRGMSAIAEAYRGMGKKQEYVATMLQVTEAGTAEDLLLRARAYEVTNQYDKYVDCLRQVIQKAPENEAKTRHDLSLTLQKTGKPDEAIKECERALELEPDNALYLQDMAYMYLKRSTTADYLNRATTLMEKAARIAPENEDVWVRLGQCYTAKNNLNAAAYCLEHAIDLEAGHGVAYLELSRVYARQGRIAMSQTMMKQYEKFVAFEQQRQTLNTRTQRENATPEDLIAYGDFLMNLEDMEGALAQYERAFNLKPKDKSLANTLRILYTRLRLTGRLEHLKEITNGQ